MTTREYQELATRPAKATRATKASRQSKPPKPSKATRPGEGLRSLRAALIALVAMIGLAAHAQTTYIKIGGNVYGGGNKGEVKENTTVTVYKGDIDNVFGGARMANVGGNTFVHLDGENATGDIMITSVYGGNDISGVIGSNPDAKKRLPSELTDVVPEPTASDLSTSGKTRDEWRAATKVANPEKNLVDSTWNAFVRTSRSTKADGTENYPIVVGSIFGGGNGDFDYENPSPGVYNIYEKNHKYGDQPIATSNTGFNVPELGKTYLEIKGGLLAHVYGGGNDATITENTTISINNESCTLDSMVNVYAQYYTEQDPEHNHDFDYYKAYSLSALIAKVKLKTFQTNLTSFDFNFARIFGGNNKAEMSIMPTWNLQQGVARDVYSGGNQGSMTSSKGLLLEIDPKAGNLKPLKIENVYGGCRMADVCPKVDGVYTPVKNSDLGGAYKFPNELAARVLVRGGDINNVYGGNDITGKVYGGNAIGIYTSIRGNVYGGGNGAYAYTDNDELADDANCSDFYYSYSGFETPALALIAHRPNAEQISIRLKGTDAEHPTIIHGSVFVGGNCASIATNKKNPMVELKIGSHVIADKVFLGNNGEQMVDSTMLLYYNRNVDENGNLVSEGGKFYSSMHLDDKSVFSNYMEGAAMDLKPAIVFDSEANGDPANYEPYSSWIGSLYCGGNVGSMTYEGINDMDFSTPINIFNKVVGGCNKAYVHTVYDKNDVPLNAEYDGGVIGTKAERLDYTEGGQIKDRLRLHFNGLHIRPMRWNDTFTPITSGTLTAGNTYYTTNLRSTEFVAVGDEEPTAEDPYYELTTIGNKLDWNTAMWSTDQNDFIAIDSTTTAYDEDRRLLGGNVYGGCYESGHVNGNVIVNINKDVINRDELFAEANPSDPYAISGARRSGVLKEAQGDDVMAVAMSMFGAGYGEETEVWGSTTVNLNEGYCFQIFGGGELGVVGKKKMNGVGDPILDGEGNYQYDYDAAYSTTVSLNGDNAGYSEEEEGKVLAETEYMYGAGNEGNVCGDSYVYLGNGRIYDAFGGASNADILGHTEVYVGRQRKMDGTFQDGFPWVRDNVYAGNDFGGTIRGKKDFSSQTTRSTDATLLEAGTYVRYLQGRVDSIFGGSYGSYDYADPIFRDYTYSRGEAVIPDGKGPGAPREGSGFSFSHINNNSFVHFQPLNNSDNVVNFIFGSSEGYPNHPTMNNAMQSESYVLLDDTETTDDTRYINTDIYAGGAFAGVGASGDYVGCGRTQVDLFTGRFHNIYGGSNREGLIGFTRVNVPEESTARVNAIFGGGKGYSNADIDADHTLAARYCDTYISTIDYRGENAIVDDAIYGGNENSRIVCDTYVNVSAPVNQASGYQATIYGAGYGASTVTGRTNVYMNDKAKAYNVFGGGRDGNSFNFNSLIRWLRNQYAQSFEPAKGPDESEVTKLVSEYGRYLVNFKTFASRVELPDPMPEYQDNIWKLDGGNLIDTKEYYNTNVHLKKGSTVTGYAYGGGMGSDAIVAGSTYIELLGGTVDRDIYGGGQGGHVYDEFELVKDGHTYNDFVATTNVYVEGGMVRNVYGGGYQGHVGKHTKEVAGKLVSADIHDPDATDIPGLANVIIGKTDVSDFYTGNPAITRNVYGAGEGGSVWGTTNVVMNNGYVGYRYKNTGTVDSPKYEYVEELDDQTPNAIELAGNIFGGGYVVNSYVDTTNVTLYGGTVRGSLYGGGEVGPIGRGTIRYRDTYTSQGVVNGKARIYKAGKTNVKMFNGNVLRNVFGGGRGKDSWGGDGTLYMDKDLVATLDMKCKGFVFGQTDVDILGGEIGTDAGMAYGYGNVFGGCDEGTVYSAYMEGDKVRVGKKEGERYGESIYQGYYYKHNGVDFDSVKVGTVGGKDKYERIFTEDCKVVIEPWLQVKADGGIKYNDSTYAKGSYIPTGYLNTLGAKNGDTWPSAWNYVDVGKVVDGKYKERGIIIHNAVFAGGNIAQGSSSMYANDTTVYGNATASIHDVYNRDFITIGTGHTGGLYGDGNLTFVGGYRELNITNYGTDKYHLANELTIDKYRELPKREQDYYERKYKCKVSCTDIEQTTYSVGVNVPHDELVALFLKSDGTSIQAEGKDVIITDAAGNKVPNPAIWEENGVVSVYAGRIMNTIQRADFCGVFGSRMVMKGAQDRVPETVDYTNYTINRVREVSLNKMVKKDEPLPADTLHGNYFGIYSVVNHLGALTSDVKMTDPRTTQADLTQNPGLAADGKTFEEWKKANINNRKRNNGNCHNQIALASGVYLELTTEKSTGKTVDTKDWGPITGVVELDLINVQPGIGGGFVYAKNEHGVRSVSGAVSTTLTDLNRGAATQWDYTYDETELNKENYETSGNFIHSSQTIIDDCYNIGGKYHSGYRAPDGVPAHYWYVAGQVYVYDQYISAYTGSPNAFSETVEIPITINAASNGAMTLQDVQPNLYAYYSSYTSPSDNVPLTGDRKLVISDTEYQLNTPISYWDWSKLTAHEKQLFVPKTYVVVDSCKIDNDTIPAGTVLLPAEYTTLEAANDSVFHLHQKKNVAFTEAFRSSNNMSHSKGYLLTYKVDNPDVWDQWYARVNDELDSEGNNVFYKKQEGGNGYEDSPTFYPIESGIYGRKDYAVNDIIPKTLYTTYQSARSTLNNDTALSDSAEFKPAYVITKEYVSDDGTQHYYPGAALSTTITGYTDSAFVSTGTLQLSVSDYIFVNQVMSKAEKNAYKTLYPSLADDIDDLVIPAYICTDAGLYGGNYFAKNKNYRALEAWSSLSEEDRKNFVFNYDALDLLVDPQYSGKVGHKYQYDGDYTTEDEIRNPVTGNKATYSLKTPIDYTATYNGTTDETTHNGIKRTNGVEYTRQQYESLPNEQRHYAAIAVEASEKDTTIYVVKHDFLHVETPYAAGSTISFDVLSKLTSDEKTNIDTLKFTAAESNKTYYYCREAYKIGEKKEGASVTSATGVTGATGETGHVYHDGDSVRLGVVISDSYSSLKNYQQNFTIHGKSPMETSTLYVSRNADINDLSTEKIITVIYKYDYEESDESGLHITPVSERHVVNIHITFKSGVPTIEDIQKPNIVLPGTSVIMRTPMITPGAYEILGGGWELFETKADAESHTNGVPYTPMADSLYWYQDGFQIAYYAKTYLGKTYSNHVPVSVANYHDLKGVMDDKAHHLHIDYDRTRLKRDAKIYINDYTTSDPLTSQNGLDLFKDLYDLSLLDSPAVDENGLISSGTFIGHKPLNNSTATGTNIYDGTTNTKGMKAGKNLEFFLRSDIRHTGEWTPIGNDSEPCFDGNFHGDGHTISGLNNSLFGHLCGNVYNLGVMGSFTSAGVADTGEGYVENCWVKSSASVNSSVYPVFGDPTSTTDGFEQTVNSYYYDGNVYKAGSKARAMTEKSFYDGELAFNLNGFYLYKRFNDGVGTASGVGYKYFTLDESGDILNPDTPLTGYYADNMDKALCSSGYNNTIKYVEDRFADGDFRYAGGEIPGSEDVRAYITGPEDDLQTTYLPVWPDDYLFFGQRLNYGYSAKDGEGNYVNPHQEVPTSIVKSSTGWVTTNETGNRVYRAPAYYRSKEMGVTHFNPAAYLAQKSSDGTKVAYPNMTAIDFAGHEDTHNESDKKAKPYELGLNGAGKFYAPLLVDDGLTYIVNKDETRNLVVYAPDVVNNSKTHGVLSAYFTDHQYDIYSDDNDEATRIQVDDKHYGRVAAALQSDIYGHLVQSDRTVDTDHFLVDKQDFNAPFSYTFEGDHRMWYQRSPDLFTDRTNGWEGVSLPFTTKMVSTTDKGEITHFYENNTAGHEYWLREYTGGAVSANPTVFTANMNSLGLAPGKKEYTNTFLWDYYYSKDERKDKNTDEYQEYYSHSHTYDGYPSSQAATPYIIGFPGSTFFEFDLSGVWTPKNRYNDVTILNPGKQTITFASPVNVTIGVSDDEMEGVSANNFIFKPNYMGKELGAYPENPSTGTYDVNYVLNATGSSYDLVKGTPVNAVPFRPYFTGTKEKVAPSRRRVEHIVFSDIDDGTIEPQEADGELTIRTGKHKIIVMSGLKVSTHVNITNLSGITLASFDINPGQTIETPVNHAGVYIVNKTKIAVK